MIKQRVQILKDEKASAPSASKLSLASAFQEQSLDLNDFMINLSIPNELLDLESRIEKLEERLSCN